MPTVTAVLHVDEKGQVTGSVPTTVPPGDYTAPIELPEVPGGKKRPILDLPVDDEPWDDSISLRREDIYGDDGR